MNEVMNRAARRAARVKTAKAARDLRVKVRNHVDVVPMEHVETYLQYEIRSEGKWRSNVPVIVLRPMVDVGVADDGWFATTLERMRETRRRKGTLPVKADLGEGVTSEVDVGLIDVVVSFETPPGVYPLPEDDRSQWHAMTENLRHFDSVCAGALHDQMIVAAAPHCRRSDGSVLFHYHNLIFGIRQEVRDDIDILGPLDPNPLLRAIGQSGPIHFIGGVKQ